jgi:hypothetical protein
VAEDELLPEEEAVACDAGVVEDQVAEPEPVPHGWWYAPGSPYPPGKADAPPTAAIKARVRSMLDDGEFASQRDGDVLAGVRNETKWIRDINKAMVVWMLKRM